MEEVKFKMDQEIINKYSQGSSVKQTFTTPLKNVRAYLTEDNKAIFIGTSKQKAKLSNLLSLVAAAKSYSLSINTEGSHLVCLLSL